MDTTFRSPHVMWRSITNSTLVTIVFLLIIGWELVTALVLAIAVGAGLWGKEAADQPSSLGWLMETALFGGGFIAVAKCHHRIDRPGSGPSAVILGSRSGNTPEGLCADG